MTTYRITNTTSGLTLGDYRADSAEEAGVAMLRDAGYPGATAEDIDNDIEIVEVEQTIRIDLDTLNEGANPAALKAAIVAEFPCVNVVIATTGRGTEVEGFADNDATRTVLRIVIERADF